VTGNERARRSLRKRPHFVAAAVAVSIVSRFAGPGRLLRQLTRRV